MLIIPSMIQKFHQIIMQEKILEIIISQSLFLYTEAYRGKVIYPFSGTAELKLRTSDSQY